MPLSAGEKLGPYEMVGLIGKGGIIQITSGPFLEAFRSDPEIAPLLFELYGR